MKAKRLVIGIACVLLISIGAQAQGLTRPWDEITPLTPQDRAVIGGVVQQQIHGRPAGTVAEWHNAASGHSGSVTLLGKSMRQGMPCERIQYLILEPGSAGQHARYVFTSCQLPDGSWKLAD